jgi:hypothetical protein
MELHDTVDLTIRNQRRRGWQVLVCAACWFIVWVGGFNLLIQFASPPRFGSAHIGILLILWAVPMLVTYVVILVRLCRLPPIRIKLGAKMWIEPGRTVPPKDIRGFRFERDPQEDFVESTRVVPTCQLTIEIAKRRFQMIVSLDDASRIGDWAEQHGVPVIDPQRYASHGVGR